METAMMLRAFLVLAIVPTAVNVTVASGAKVTITQRALLPLCVNASPAGDRRQWSVAPGEVTTLAVTMNNRPRPGVRDQAPGVATISFVSENGHQYEIEVRAEPSTYSRRVWPAQEWTPVVRDRTTDRIVSSAPQWGAGRCGG
jgi:hypothetical protein